MAKVKITGHASGTGILTVTAPDTDVNRTITLPDATMTIPEYATGSWTPVLSGSATATIAQNKYVRIGNVVHCWSQIQNIGNIPGSGNFYIDSGLPFAPALDASVCGSVMLNYVNINGGSTYTVVPSIDSSGDVYLYRLEDNDEWGSVAWSAFSTNDDVQIYLTYYTEA